MPIAFDRAQDYAPRVPPVEPAPDQTPPPRVALHGAPGAPVPAGIPASRPPAAAPAADPGADPSAGAATSPGPRLGPESEGAGEGAGAHYVLGEPLHQGGMATVFLGRRVAPGGFEHEVLLKRLRSELLTHSRGEELLLREARLCARLSHPNIVAMWDVCDLEGERYLAMEYVRGGDLRVLMRRARRRGQRFSVAAVLHVGRELLAALDYAHGQRRADGRSLGLVHRDVSPANVLLSQEGEVKLTDFGIAQDADVSAEIPESLLRARGKVGYMAPEQARGDRVDVRADLFSVAAVLYEVLTGKRLFVGQVEHSPAEVYGVPITIPSKLRPGVPAGLDGALLKALAPLPAQRFQSARAFHQALLEVTRQHGLWLDRLELAAHLREVCGPDPTLWGALDERSGTALIASLDGDEILVDEDAITGARTRSTGRSGDRASDQLLDQLIDHEVDADWGALARDGAWSDDKRAPVQVPAEPEDVAVHEREPEPAITVQFEPIGPGGPLGTIEPGEPGGPLDACPGDTGAAAEPGLYDSETVQVTRSLPLDVADLVELNTAPALKQAPPRAADVREPANETQPIDAVDLESLDLTALTAGLGPRPAAGDFGDLTTARQLRAELPVPAPPGRVAGTQGPGAAGVSGPLAGFVPASPRSYPPVSSAPHALSYAPGARSSGSLAAVSGQYPPALAPAPLAPRGGSGSGSSLLSLLRRAFGAVWLFCKRIFVG